MILFLDTETYSTVPIRHGTSKYVTGVEVTIVSWAVDDGPVQVWDRTANPQTPTELEEAAFDCDTVIAHNAAFDRNVVEASLPDLGALLSGKWYCTMAAALRHGLPGALDKLCTVFRVPESDAKHAARPLLLMFCKPNRDGERNTRETHPKEWKEFLDYAGSDIRAMRYIYRAMPKWNDSQFELDLWNLDQRINQRGIAVDVDFAKAAVRATTAEQKRLAARTNELTEGAVERTTQRDLLLRFLLAEHGVDLPDLKADTIERRLGDPELQEHVKETLRIRQDASKSSTSKYRRVLEMQVDGRLRYLLQYCGALRTGRWGGRDFQPQNLKRPTLKFPQILEAIEAVKDGAEELLLDNIMEAMSSAVRSVLCAGEGRKLVITDLSNIEGRVLPFLAGEEQKLQAFRDFDAGIGPDSYKVAYARSFDVDPADVDDGDQRQIGKVQELAMGYQGGVAAFVSMASAYGMDLQEMADKAYPTIPKVVLLDSHSTYQWAKRKRRTLGLPEDIYVVCEALKRLWRAAHPAIVSLWHDVEVAARAAIMFRGATFNAGLLSFDRQGAWLRMKLPSGRYLLYPNPKVEDDTIKFAAWNVYKKAWTHEGTYGGKLVENAVQALSRDVMANAMGPAEAAGYPIVLTVHDELVTEPEDDPRYTAEELSGILATVPAWAKGLPLAAKGYETQRYRKS